ncbi:unnamed protein product [Phytophthora fragariaefolia]|uniref:Unnamed protein product n=1 Tax=Phytophthora fragariaefolia TaxID=1490495 RepID=A0A9W6WWA6_9STRA|nr:unnamed protein product [Phytophthora fragariaefolia]
MQAFSISHDASCAPGAVKAGSNRGMARSGSLQEAPRGVTAGRGGGAAATRAEGKGFMCVLATQRRAGTDVTTAAEAAATTAADPVGSGVVAALTTEAWTTAKVLEGVDNPTSTCPGVFDLDRSHGSERCGGRRCESGSVIAPRL